MGIAIISIVLYKHNTPKGTGGSAGNPARQRASEDGIRSGIETGWQNRYQESRESQGKGPGTKRQDALSARKQVGSSGKWRNVLHSREVTGNTSSSFNSVTITLLREEPRFGGVLFSGSR
jgi:hypothetical protein